MLIEVETGLTSSRSSGDNRPGLMMADTINYSTNGEKMKDEQAARFHHAEISGSYFDANGVLRWNYMGRFTAPIDQFLVGFFHLSGVHQLDDSDKLDWFDNHIYHGEALTDNTLPDEVYDAAMKRDRGVYRITAFDALDQAYAWWYVQTKYDAAIDRPDDPKTVNEALDQVFNQVSDLAKTLRSLRDMLDERKRDDEALKELHEKASAIEGQLEEAKSSISSADDEVSSASESIAELVSELDDLKASSD